MCHVQRLLRHYLVIMTMVGNDIHSLDNVRVFQCRANAKLCRHLLLILFFAFSGPFGPELLDSEYVTAVLMAGFNQSNCTASSGTKDAAPFAIFL